MELPPPFGAIPVPPPFQALEAWGRQLTAEVVGLPQTLTELREGAENFRKVTERLLDATAALEQIAEVSASAGEIRQKVDQAARAMREQVGSIPGGERIVGPLEDLNSTLTALARLSPFWTPGSRPTPK